jgi:hypothetical protein
MQFVVDQDDSEESLSSKRLLLAVKMIVVLMNVTFASSRKVAKKGVDVNVHRVEEAASVRELRELRELHELHELHELAQKENQMCSVTVTRCTH